MLDDGTDNTARPFVIHAQDRPIFVQGNQVDHGPALGIVPARTVFFQGRFFFRQFGDDDVTRLRGHVWINDDLVAFAELGLHARAAHYQGESIGADAPFCHQGIHAASGRVGIRHRVPVAGGDVINHGHRTPPRTWRCVGGRGGGSYSRGTTLPAGAGFVNVWEDGGFMTLAASQAACASTPGTYFPTAHVGAITLYIHPASGDPAANGRVYEITARPTGIHLTGAGCTVKGIHTRRNFSESGSLVMGNGAQMIDARASEGGKHNAFFAFGRVYGCIFDDAAYNASGKLLVAFTDVDNQGAVVEDSAFSLAPGQADSMAEFVTAFTCHTPSGQKFANVTLRGNTVTDFKSASISGADVTNFHVLNNQLTDAGPIAPGANNVQIVVRGNRSKNINRASMGFITSAVPANYTISGNLICRNAAAGTVISLTGSATVVTVEDNIASINTSGGFPRVWLEVNDGTLVYNRNTVEELNNGLSGFMRLGESGTVSYAGDNNHWGPDSTQFRFDAVDYNLAGWKSATGQDGNSDAIADGSVACA